MPRPYKLLRGLSSRTTGITRFHQKLSVKTLSEMLTMAQLSPSTTA